jgi:hypothetical protein
MGVVFGFACRVNSDSLEVMLVSARGKLSKADAIKYCGLLQLFMEEPIAVLYGKLNVKAVPGAPIVIDAALDGCKATIPRKDVILGDVSWEDLCKQIEEAVAKNINKIVSGFGGKLLRAA